MPGADLIKQCETQTWICKIQEKQKGAISEGGKLNKKSHNLKTTAR